MADVHPNSALSAEAAEEAAAQGRFWEMHDLLFANQDALLLADLLRYASDLGLDITRFERERHAARVAQDVDSADAAGVVGTPSRMAEARRTLSSQPDRSEEDGPADPPQP